MTHPRRLSFLLGVAVARLALGAATVFAQGNGVLQVLPREPIQPAFDVAPNVLTAGETQTVFVTIRNVNGEYDVNRLPLPQRVSPGDVFVVRFSSTCAVNVQVSPTASSLTGVLQTAVTAPNSVSITFNGIAEFFEPSDFIRIQIGRASCRE